MSVLAPILFVLLLPLSLFKVVDQALFKPMPPHMQAGFVSTIETTPSPGTSPTPEASSTTQPTPTPSSPSLPKTSSAPAEVLSSSFVIDFSDWKLTLPTGSAGHPTEIKYPGLAGFQEDPWFIKTGEGAFRFRAPVNGVTTGGSKYPRSELREMSQKGTVAASWASAAGIHTFFIDEAITAVPQAKKHVVSGQIHDANDDVLVIRLEFPKLYINVDGKNVYLLDPGYTLGKRFTVKFEAGEGKTKVYYNNSQSPVYVLDKNYSGAYFKAGAYTQSNCSKESVCSFDNYGEVIIYSAKISHQS